MSAGGSTQRASAVGTWASASRTRVAPFLLLASVEVALAWTLVRGDPLEAGHWSFPVVFGLWGAVFAVAVVGALRLPRRGAVGLILAASIALRLAALAGPPSSSDDLYRYSWDGRVQAAGIDPYAEPPAAAQLAGLRESWLWPDAADCAALGRRAGCTRINRPRDLTIYPPFAEAYFDAVYRLAGIGARYKPWQVGGLLTETATLGLLVVALRRWRRDPRWVALYGLCPAPVVEIVNNGHVDGLAIPLIVAALIVLAPRPRGGRYGAALSWRDVAAAALIGAAALVKLYPAALLLPLVACRRGRRIWALAATGATVAALAAVAYAPHVARVGAKVLGYLPGYLLEENYRSGGRFLIANVMHVPHAWAGLVSVLAVALVAGWMVLRRPSLTTASAAMLAALLLASSPAQTWYAISLLAVVTVSVEPCLLAVLAGGYVASFSTALDRANSARIGGWGYAAALAVIIVVAALHRRANQPAEDRLAPTRTGSFPPRQTVDAVRRG